jgi:hypothetical protein
LLSDQKATQGMPYWWGLVTGLLNQDRITIMLGYHAELNLSPNQVQNLETLRDEFQREAIRYDADIRIAELELQKLLRAESVDWSR